MVEFLLLASIVGFGWAWRCGRRDRSAMLAAKEREAGHARALGLVAKDLGAAGLALAAQAEKLTPPDDAFVGREARQISALADGIAEHLAAFAGPRRLLLEPVALGALVDETVATTAVQLGSAARRWRVAAEIGSLTVQADRRALRGALLPVLARAARSTRDGDWIELRAVLTEESLAIVVEDEGVGLAAEDLGASAAVTEAERTRGLGFGLATARALLEAHGGALRLEAVRGVGARAWLTLPRARLVAT